MLFDQQNNFVEIPLVEKEELNIDNDVVPLVDKKPDNLDRKALKEAF